MDILFEIVSRHKFSADFSTQHLFGEAGGVIGRAPDCNWVLPDSQKQISRKHALITCLDGAFFIEDVSANGVFLELGRERLTKGRPHRIEHGEGFIIGDYTIMAKIMANPGLYVGSLPNVEQNLFAETALSLDPLKAIDEEAERIAAQRLGNFNDLLNRNVAPAEIPPDHNDPREDALLPITAAPDPITLPYDPWDVKSKREQPQAPAAEVVPVHEAPVPHHDTGAIAMSEVEVFFRALGLGEPPAAQDERERIMHLAATLLKESVKGLATALQNRAETKNELRLPMTTTTLSVGNNPLKYSPTPEAALATLLGPQQKGVLESAEAVRMAFRDLHGHQMGLLAGARAAVQASLGKVSPDSVEKRLDANGEVRFFRAHKLWSTFIKMHHAQMTDEDGFAGLFHNDFARAYSGQIRTLDPLAYRRQKGDK